jgi:hypothetical protein
MGVVAAALVAHAATAAAKTARRPAVRIFAGASAPASYYLDGPAGVAAQHEAVLAWLAASGCKRLGLFIGGDSYDYPLTWRAMQRGVEVRHVVRPSAWPCAVFSDRGVPPGAGQAWSRTEHAFLYVPATPLAPGEGASARSGPR